METKVSGVPSTKRSACAQTARDTGVLERNVRAARRLEAAKGGWRTLVWWVPGTPPLPPSMTKFPPTMPPWRYYITLSPLPKCPPYTGQSTESMMLSTLQLSRGTARHLRLFPWPSFIPVIVQRPYTSADLPLIGRLRERKRSHGLFDRSIHASSLPPSSLT